MGDQQVGIKLTPRKSLEFLLRLGEPEDSEPGIEISPEACKASATLAEDSCSVVLEFMHRSPDVRIAVHSEAGPGSVLRKSLTIENADTKPLVIFDVVLEQTTLPDGFKVSGGGRGWPVFIKDVGFAAVEFPESENIVSRSQYSLEYYPAVVLKPGERYQTESAVFEFAPEDPEGALRRYVDEFKLRKSAELFACYSSRGAHECEGPNESILNEQLDHVLDLKTNWRVPFEYYIIDYGYWPDGSAPWETGDFTCIDREKRFPAGSFKHILSRMSAGGIKLGMWFGNGCPARKDFAAKLQESLLELNAKHDLKLIKADFSEWDCSDASHDHRPGKYMRYQAARNMMEAFAAVKAADPEVIVCATGFTRSPWWLKHVDFTAVAREDASDSPAPSLRDSQILQTDLDHRFFELDQGTCLSYSDSHFWSGKQCWRKNLLMSLSRSNQLLLSGEIHLLDEDDKLFLQRAAHMRKVHAASFAETRRILGRPSAGEVYGYSNRANGRGFVAIFNPSWEEKAFDVRADDLGCDSSVRNVCVELFPETNVAAIPAGGGHFHMRIDPWEVLWLEVGPSEEHCELLESKPEQVKNCATLVTRVEPPPETENSLTMPLEQVYYHTGSIFRCRPVLPRSWQGFPLLIGLHELKGELYINNRPLTLPDNAEFALLYPWTPQYGLVKFGRENLFYLATNDTNLTSQSDIIFRAIPYFSSSACREDWPHASDATMVVMVRYLQDGVPFRHSFDPRMAECGMWLDGVSLEPYRVPPLVPRIWSKFSWAVFMLDLEDDWECIRALVPQLVECDYDVQVFLTDRVTAAAYARG